MKRHIAYFVLCYVLVQSSLVHAGYSLLIERNLIVDLNDGQQKRSKVHIEIDSDGAFYKRISRETGEELYIDAKKSTVTSIDRNQKTFWTMSLRDYRPFAYLEFLPFGASPDGQSGVRFPAPVFKATGHRVKIDNCQTEEFRIERDENEGAESFLYTCSNARVPLESKIDELQMFIAYDKSLVFQKLFEELRGLPGYPVRLRTVVSAPQGKMTTIDTLQDAKLYDIPKEKFAVSTSGLRSIENPLKKHQKADKAQ
jgi:hypothetical protein